MDDKRKDFGVLYGQKTTEDALLIYSSYEDSKASPETGDFIVLTPRDENGRKYLARVEAEIYDEDPIFRSQDKTLVAVHYARIAERDLSDRDKQKMFSYTYKVKILGTFSADGKNFETAVRKLPTVSYHARHITPRELDNILNKSNERGVEIGNLCIGTDIKFTDKSILFDINKLKEKRTMIFAQSGFGKTNLMKVMLYHMIGDTSYGKLIFDLNGEYCFRSKFTYGLADIDDQKIKDNLILFTDKKFDDRYQKRFIYGGPTLLNMHKHLTVGDILSFGAGFSEVMKSFLQYLDDNQVEDFITNINAYVHDPKQLHAKYPDFFEQKKETSARTTIAAIRKRIGHLIEEEKGLHSHQSTMVEKIFEYLKQGKTVVVDLSLKDSYDANVVSTILTRKLFENNKMFFTEQKDDKVVDCVMCVEEAQNVISEEFVRTNANPFVRVAKEGRKFKIGMIAITQRPSAIAEEIRSQAENFFSFYMGNSDDIKALVRSNIHYDGVISKFLQTETIPGNLYMVSVGQSFALPTRVQEFEKLVGGKVYADSRFDQGK
ncbi:ATP-binding protein [candidate division KSB1 bacterium]|nr:ATP-binding protein [candidate division KSB1 bacterium]